MRKLAFGAVCVLFMQLFGLPFLTTGHMGIEAAHAQYFKGEPFQAYPRPMDAPFASWQEADGATTSLLRYKGDVLLVNFWATWCGPCVIEMPDLDAIQKKYGAAGLKVLAISIDEEGVDKVKEFYKKNDLQNLEIFNDSDGSSAAAFGVKKLPTSFLIDHEGKAIGVVDGFARWEKPEYEAELRIALKRRAESQAETAEPFVNTRRVMGVDN
ncbi:MAG: thiol:disulfide interchange protein [Magnetococcales bacterium]|nr:thiol:disulfide interchange protein [Magnetococcales bacterium]